MTKKKYKNYWSYDTFYVLKKKGKENKMESTGLLCDSFLCRLCAEENRNGTSLFAEKENEQDLSQLVNKYLPLKVKNDRKFPCTICPGCNIQLEATKSFLDLIIEGQDKLRSLLKTEQETLRRQEKQKQQLQEALKSVNSTSTVETYTIQSDETGEKFLIQILSDGPLFAPEHELSLRAEGLDKPKRKRGRPPKQQSKLEDVENETVTEESEKQPEPEPEDENDNDGRRRRRVKVPTRFQEAVQGKELDRMFKEVGVIDEDSLSEEENNSEDINSTKVTDEIIGHMQSKDGENLGELVIINRNSMRRRLKTKNGQVLKRKKKYSCEICSRQFLHYGWYKIHKNFHQNIRFECKVDSCNVQTKTKDLMEQHQIETGHNEITIIETAPHCNETENAANVTNNVPGNNDNKEKFSCTTCNKTYSCKQNYETHYKVVHENQKQFQCNKCDKAFPYLNSLKTHMHQHFEKGEKVYPCEVCNKVFNRPSSLVYHKEAEHNNGRRFVCSKCNRSFKHKQLLQRHQLVHSDLRPYVCKSCDASFKTKANLINHMPIHTGEKKYFCSQCGQTFAHKTSLTLHMRWHNGQKPYQCDVCKKSFSQKGNLAEHRRIHTGEKPYCCHHCGRSFTTSSQFKLHIKRHTGERPWKCEYCTKSFLHKDTWKCHTRRHRNERPYQCAQCSRGFTEQWALKKHERLHTGEKPYVCDTCGKSFADCSNLTKHKKIHNNNINKNQGKQIIMDAKQEENNVLYLTYNNEDGEQTFVNFVDPLDTVSSFPSPSNNEDLMEQTPLNIEEATQMSLETKIVQEFVDEDGTPISLSTSDGQQIKVVTIIEEKQQHIKGLMPDGTLVPINLTMEDGKAVLGEIISPVVLPNELKSEESNHSNSSELLDKNIQFLSTTDNGQKLENIQFLTDDGQNVFVVDSLNQQYLSIPQF